MISGPHVPEMFQHGSVYKLLCLLQTLLGCTAIILCSRKLPTQRSKYRFKFLKTLILIYNLITINMEYCFVYVNISCSVVGKIESVSRSVNIRQWVFLCTHPACVAGDQRIDSLAVMGWGDRVPFYHMHAAKFIFKLFTIVSSLVKDMYIFFSRFSEIFYNCTTGCISNMAFDIPYNI